MVETNEMYNKLNKENQQEIFNLVIALLTSQQSQT